jgi:hypothetical protein
VSILLLLLTLLVLFLLLYWLAILFSKNLYIFFFLLSKNKELSVHLLSWFLLPGTVIHEVSHMFVAELIGVRTGEFTFAPEVKGDEEGIRIGGLKIAKSGPFRRTLIGLAPPLFGSLIIVFLFHFIIFPNLSDPASLLTVNLLTALSLVLSIYLVFIVSNTMFSSSKDLEAASFPLFFILLLSTAYWLSDFKITVPEKVIIGIANALKGLNIALLGTIMVDLLFLAITKLLTLFSSKILKRKVI